MLKVFSVRLIILYSLQRTSDFVLVAVVIEPVDLAPVTIETFLLPSMFPSLLESYVPFWVPLFESKFNEFLLQLVDDVWVGEDDCGAVEDAVVVIGLVVVTTCAFVTLFVTVAIFPLELFPLGGTGILLLASAAVLALPVKLL